MKLSKNLREKIKQEIQDSAERIDIIIAEGLASGQLQTQIKAKEIKGRFLKPSLKEIQEHIKEKGYLVNAITFFNHYESNGWRVGKVSMKSWQAAVANWNSRDKEEKKPLMAKKETPDYIKKMQKDYKEKIGAK